MEKLGEKVRQMSSIYELDGRVPLRQAIPLGIQHVLAMFLGNISPLLIICGMLQMDSEIKTTLIQNSMFIAGVATLIQLYPVWKVGSKLPVVMGTSSGFIGVFNSVVGVMGGGVVAYGAIMCASIIGGIFEGILGFCLKPLRRFFPAW